MELDVELLDHQADFADDVESDICVMEGGLGCGKTFSLLVKMLRLVEESPGVPGLIVEPTYDLIGSVILASVDEFLPQWGIRYQYRTRWRGRSDVLLVHAGTKKQTPVYLRSGDVPKRIVGFKVGWFFLDEADQMDQAVWQRAMGRMRHRGAKHLQANCVFTPEPGFNWTWRVFHENPPAKAKLHLIEGIPTTVNVHNPEGYAENLDAAHDEGERDRVLKGVRSALSGRVFRRFDRSRHVRPCDDPLSGELQMWCDFNVGKMAWSFVSVRGDRAHVFAELVREDTDTIECADLAAAMWARLISERRGYPVEPYEAAKLVKVIADAAGDNASTSAKHSDLAILRQRGFRVFHVARNPFIEDSVLAVNLALKDGWLLFDDGTRPDGSPPPVLPPAKYVVTCIEQQPRGKDGKPAKAKDPKEGLDHGADGVRYGVFHNRPAWVPRGNQRGRAG